jgi:hypothetical protein
LCMRSTTPSAANTHHTCCQQCIASMSHLLHPPYGDAGEDGGMHCTHGQCSTPADQQLVATTVTGRACDHLLCGCPTSPSAKQTVGLSVLAA